MVTRVQVVVDRSTCELRLSEETSSVNILKGNPVAVRFHQVAGVCLPKLGRRHKTDMNLNVAYIIYLLLSIQHLVV